MEQCKNAHRVLLVDDDPAFAGSIAEILRAAGFEVCVAPDYRLALQEIESTRPIDLLLTDIVMPGRVNGIALSRMARMRRPDINVMYLTGYDLADAEREALGPILRKPVDGPALVAQVRRVSSGLVS